MATYKKQNFTPEQILQAAHLNNIEDGVVMIEDKADAAQAHSENVEAILTQKLNTLDNKTSSNLSNAVSVLNSTVDDLVSDTSDEFATVRSEMASADSKLQSDINKLTSIHNTDKASLESSLTSTASHIAQNAEDIDSLEATDKTHTEQIAAVQNRLGQLENTVSSMLTIDDVKALIAEQLLTAPNGSQYKLCVDNSGVLSAMLVFEADSGENSEEEEVNPDEPNPAS